MTRTLHSSITAAVSFNAWDRLPSSLLLAGTSLVISCFGQELVMKGFGPEAVLLQQAVLPTAFAVAIIGVIWGYRFFTHPIIRTALPAVGVAMMALATAGFAGLEMLNSPLEYLPISAAMAWGSLMAVGIVVLLSGMWSVIARRTVAASDATAAAVHHAASHASDRLRAISDRLTAVEQPVH